MEVLLAPDKFKGCLTAAEVVGHLGRGLAERGVSFRRLPLADGGDGSVDAAIAAGFRPVQLTVEGATGQEHHAVAAFDGTTAVVEVANTCGLSTLPGNERAPLAASSRGLGQAMVQVLRGGATRVVLALGGSASTDGGAGMLTALGAVFSDEAGRPLTVAGGTLHQVASVDFGAMIDLTGITITIATDVRNPLTGPSGAAAVYGPQKGAGPAGVRFLDAGLGHLVNCVRDAGHPDASGLAAVPGSGAAGGLGFAGLLLGGHVVSGAEYFLDLLDFETHLQGCDLVVTGEGRMDDQTAEGKLPAVVAHRSRSTPVIAVVGRSDLSAGALTRMGIRDVHALVDHTTANPAQDPELSGQLLRKLARTIRLTYQRGGAT